MPLRGPPHRLASPALQPRCLRSGQLASGPPARKFLTSAAQYYQTVGERFVAERTAQASVNAVVPQDSQRLVWIERHVTVVLIAAPPKAGSFAAEHRDRAVEAVRFGPRKTRCDGPVVLHFGVNLAEVQPVLVTLSHQVDRQQPTGLHRARQFAKCLRDISTRVQVVQHVAG
jgi:hypothetical protein